MTDLKINPKINYKDFLNQAKKIKSFKSVKGHEYLIKEWNDSIMTFERLSTNKIWKMDVKNVHKAYLELNSFKTVDFKPYVNRTHSPALGLLLTLKLLKRA